MSRSRSKADQSKAPGYLARRMKVYARAVAADKRRALRKARKAAPVIPLRIAA